MQSKDSKNQNLPGGWLNREKGDTTMFIVQIVSAGGVRHDLYGDLTEREAIDFCEENNWHYLDENCFEWDLDYVEDYGRG